MSRFLVVALLLIGCTEQAPRTLTSPPSSECREWCAEAGAEPSLYGFTRHGDGTVDRECSCRAPNRDLSTEARCTREKELCSITCGVARGLVPLAYLAICMCPRWDMEDAGYGQP